MKPLTKKQRDIMGQHIEFPTAYPQALVMKTLKLGSDYNRFYRLFYRTWRSRN